MVNCFSAPPSSARPPVREANADQGSAGARKVMVDQLWAEVELTAESGYAVPMTDLYIQRRLKVGDNYLSEAEVLVLGPVLVVLAEPGAGKSDLLKEFGRLIGISPVRASRFRHQTKVQPYSALIIDAVDEAAKIDQAAVDEIIVKAHENSNGRVIFASRSSEWQEARTGWIKECFGSDPVIVQIEQLQPAEQKTLFDSHLPGEDFDAFSAETARFELTPLLGNPQFLLLFANAYVQSGRHFTSKAQIFRDAVERLAIEAGNVVSGTPRPATHEIVAAASEAMAKILLAGGSGVSTKEHIADLDYPYLAGLVASAPANALRALDTRLFRPAVEPDRHEPVHRIVAEYCAAQFLVRRISDHARPLSLRRVLAVIAPNGAVRDELRGLLGWIASAGTERIQRAAIELDAYAVLANGDPSQLTVGSKRLLLQKLEAIANTNPGFRRSDFWRRFSVGGFFTDDLTDDLRRMLATMPLNSPLIDLLLELLVNSGGPGSLADDVRNILFNTNADRTARMWAARAIRRLTGTMAAADLDRLIQEGSAASLRVAIDMISEAGVEETSDDSITALLRSFGKAYPKGRKLRDEDSYMASYYLVDLIKHLSAETIARNLDDLTEGLTCTCKRAYYECECRHGVSKVAGHLLDRYFEVNTGPYDPDRIWRWLSPLWFKGRGNREESPAIKVLTENSELRHELHKRAFDGVSDDKAAWEKRWQIGDGHHHSGLSFYAGDDQRMAVHAFETDNAGLWSAFWSRPVDDEERRGPDPLRRLLRQQSREKSAFSCTWAAAERSYRTVREKEQRNWQRRQRRWQKREAQQSDRDRAHLLANRAQIEGGNHWGWAKLFAKFYLHDRGRLSDYTDDMSLVENALRNALPMIKDHMPTLEQLAGNRHWTTPEVAYASCWLQFVDTGTLEHIDRLFLLPVKVEASKYDWMEQDRYDAFQRELDRILFDQPGSAEAFARTYIEPGLSGPREGHTNVWWLGSKEMLAPLRSKLSMEWLHGYPDMPVHAQEELFNIAAATADRLALLALIHERVQGLERPPVGESIEETENRNERLKFWKLRRFFFEGPEADGWDGLRDDPDLIFALDYRAGGFADRLEGWPGLSADKVFKIMDAFVEAWPPVFLPSSYGSGDPPAEQAFRFLTHIVWRIGQDSPGRALPVLDRMLADPRFQDFSEALLTLRAESAKKLALADFSAPSPAEVVSLLDAGGLATVEDLRALVVEELEWLQDWLRTAETDPLATYYQDGAHVDENTGRNRVVDSLRWRMTSLNLPVVIEHHMADSNRCDFTVSAMIGGRRRLLVVEVKGQWHPEVYTAAAAQLSQRYSSHQEAEQQGIYLVFWFGPATKVADRLRHGVTTAVELQEKIRGEMPEELRGLVDVVVLDVSWSGAVKAKATSRKAR